MNVLLKLNTVTLADIMNRSVQHVAPDCTLTEAAQQMSQARISSLLVMENNLPIGIITERDMLRWLDSGVSGTLPVTEIMSAPVITVTSNTDFGTAYSLALAQHIRHLVVVDDQEHVLGLVTETDFRHHLSNDILQVFDDLESVMDAELPVLTPHDNLHIAIKKMLRERTTFVLIIDNKQPLGILTERDIPNLLANFPNQQPETIGLHQVMHNPVITVLHKSSVVEVVNLMQSQQLRHTVVVDQDNTVIGVITLHNLLVRITNTLTYEKTIVAQQQLQQDKQLAEQRLHLAIEASQLTFWELNCLTKQLQLNNKPLSYPENQDDIKLDAWFELIHPDDREEVIISYQKAKQLESELIDIEYRIKDQQTGQWLWMQNRGRVVQKDASGLPVFLAGTSINIGQRKQIEQTLRASEQHLRTIISTEPECVKIIAADGQLLEMNPAGLAMLEISSLEEAQQHNLLDFILPDYQLAFINLHQRVMAGASGMLEFEIRGLKGSYRWLETHAAPIFNDQGQVTMLLGITRDISERKKSEIDLKASETKLATILNNISASVYIKDTQDNYQFANRYLCELLGETAESIVGKNDIDFFAPDSAQQLALNDHSVLADGIRLETQDFLHFKNSHHASRHYLSTKLPLYNSAGDISGLCGISTDITDFKRIVMQNEIERRMLQMLTLHEPLIAVLTNLAIGYEDIFPGMLCSILLIKDNVYLQHCAAPSLPTAYCQSLHNIPIGATVGSCGTAAYTKKTVIVSDIANNPLWHDFKELALIHGLQACWSVPIINAHDQVLGTFALYYPSPCIPLTDEVKMLERGASLASIAISYHNAENALKKSEHSLKNAQSVAKIGSWQLTTIDNQLTWSAETYRIFGIAIDTPVSYSLFLDRVHPDDRLAVDSEWQKALQGTPYQFEHRIVVGSEIRWVEERAELEFDAQGNCLNAIGTVQDITERKQIQQSLHNSYQRFSKLVKALPIGLCFVTNQGIIEYMNDRFTQIFGYRNEDIPTVDAWWPLAYPDADYRQQVMDIWFQALQTAITSKQDIPTLEVNISCKNGDVRIIEVSGVVFEDGFMATFIDQTERRQTENEMRKLFQAVNQSSNAIVICDINACIEYVNKAFTEYTGYSGDEVMGKNMCWLQADAMQQSIYQDMWASLSAGKNWQGELISKRKDGSEYIELVRMSPVRKNNGAITHYLSIHEDISERKQIEQRIHYLAHYDVLTGLPNRIQIENYAKSLLSLERTEQKMVAVIFLDIDHFKDINDSLGHHIGDFLLVEVAKRLQSQLQAKDMISRQGGDEFIMLLPDVDRDQTAQIAANLMNVINETYQIENFDLKLTASIGIACYPEDGSNLETLAKNADTAMYRAKRAGRNAFCFFMPEMQTHSTRHLQLVSALNLALSKNQLSLVYQPQLALANAQLVGAEVLLRWQHPELGDISPVEFISIAEYTGLIIPIGEWVLRTAIKQAKVWQNKGILPLTFAVNLSAVQFKHVKLSELITNLLNEEGLSAEYLELELTESVAMFDPVEAVAVMNKLHQCGISMSIDDFGTGYSSLSYLKKFKTYKLKIDQSFVRDINIDPEDNAIVSAIINMAKSLGLKTIAEGVETAEQLTFLQNQGCDEIQGYYYSKPLTTDQFEKFYRQMNQPKLIQ